MAANETVALTIKLQGGDQATNTIKSFRDQVKEAKKDMDDAVKKFGEFSPEASRAAERVKSITNAFTPLKTQLREAQDNLGLVVQKFGLASREAAAAARKVADLKDTIGDAKTLTDAFNPDRKFQALSQVIGGVAAGFSAFQGAVALTGVKSEELEKQLLKVQGALALSNGINQLLELKDTFAVVANVIKTNVVAAFTTLRGAIIATGVGALAVALGLVIANFDRVKKAVLDLFPGLAKLGEIITGIVNKITDWIGVSSEAERQFSKAVDAQKKQLEEAEKFLDQNADKFDQYTNRKFQAEVDYQKKVAEINKKAQDEGRQLTEQDEKDLKAYLDKRNRAIDAADKDRSAIAVKNAEAEAAKRAQDEEKRKQQAAAAKAKADKLREAGLLDPETLDALDAQRESIYQKGLADADRAVQSTISTQQQITAAEQANSEARRRIKTEKMAAKQEMYNLEMQIVSNVIDLIGRNTAVGKALSIAQTTIETYQSASTIFAQAAKNPAAIAFPAFPYIQAAAAITAGLLRVKQIASVQVPKGGGGVGVSTPSVQGNANAPISPRTFTQAQTVTLDSNSINQLGNKSNIRAYVVDQDIKDNDRRNQRIERASTLGG